MLKGERKEIELSQSILVGSKGVLGQITGELEDHLIAINENTTEIQSNFEYLCEIDRKIEKLVERIDELSMIVKGKKEEKKAFDIKKLTKKEKEIFMAIYQLTEEKKEVTYKQIAKKICATESLVSAYVTSLIEKGIPIAKRYAGKIAKLTLNKAFRDVQAKQNIVGINSLLSYWIR